MGIIELAFIELSQFVFDLNRILGCFAARRRGFILSRRVMSKPTFCDRHHFAAGAEPVRFYSLKEMRRAERQPDDNNEAPPRDEFLFGEFGRRSVPLIPPDPNRAATI